ncbi:MAG: hypothetical protein JWO43_429 [Candidatus Adlerbacteria bacterium]|nr:hypothetical protein [Candidatus Adlerbacteria bacterium]
MSNIGFLEIGSDELMNGIAYAKKKTGIDLNFVHITVREVCNMAGGMMYRSMLTPREAVMQAIFKHNKLKPGDAVPESRWEPYTRAFAKMMADRSATVSKSKSEERKQIKKAA